MVSSQADRIEILSWNPGSVTYTGHLLNLTKL